MLNHNYIGTRHILLGLIHEGEGVAAKIAGVPRHLLEACAARSRRSSARGPAGAVRHIPFTPRQKVLELSLREALQLGHNYIGTEHILLGLIREGGACRPGAREARRRPLPVRQQVIQLLAAATRGKEAAVGRIRRAGGESRQSLHVAGARPVRPQPHRRRDGGKLDPVIGRVPKSRQVMQVLSRRTRTTRC